MLTHLESFIDTNSFRDGSAQRECQILQATAFFQDQLQKKPNLKLAIIAGDFNWDDERIRKETCPNTSLLDLLGGGDNNNNWKDPGKCNDYTYDGKENLMLLGNLRRRFDRCIYMTNSNFPGTTTTTITTRLDKLGMTAIPNLTWNKKNPFNGDDQDSPCGTQWSFWDCSYIWNEEVVVIFVFLNIAVLQ